MTAAANLTSMIAAGVAPTKGRQAKHVGAAASAFSDALGPARQRSGQHEPGGHGKIRNGEQHERQARHPLVAADTVAARSKAPAEPLDEMTQRELSAFDNADLEDEPAADAEGKSDETTAAPALPPQIRAEQAITVMLAMAPVARDAEPTRGDPGEAAVADPMIDDQAAIADEAVATNPPPAATADLKLHAVSKPKSETSGDPQPVRIVFATQSLATASATAAAAKNASDSTGKQIAIKQAATPPAPVSADALPSRGPHQTGKVEKRADRPGSGAEKPLAKVADGEVPQQVTATTPAAKSSVTTDSSKHQAWADASGSKNSESKHNDTQPVAVKVSVLAQQASPAPAGSTMNPNATAIVATIAGDHAKMPLSNPSLRAFGNVQPMRSLKIELHPAELGAVTANLKTSGGQLSVELQVENDEAYQVLSADSDALVQSLRSLGFDIDHISIQQPQAASTIVARAEASTDSGSFSRDTSSFQSGNSGNNSERSGGQASGRGDRNDAQKNDQPRQARPDRAGGDIYI